MFTRITFFYPFIDFLNQLVLPVWWAAGAIPACIVSNGWEGILSTNQPAKVGIKGSYCALKNVTTTNTMQTETQ